MEQPRALVQLALDFPIPMNALSFDVLNMKIQSETFCHRIHIAVHPTPRYECMSVPIEEKICKKFLINSECFF